MLDVIIAMLPMLAWASYRLGIRSLTVTLATALSCVIAEAVYQLIAKKPITVKDLSAVVTGMLIAFNVPVTIPIWMPMLAGVFAIIVVKQIFGGIGHNIVNPALAGRVFLFLSYPSYMVPTNNSYPKYIESLVNTDTVPAVDTVASATPLEALSERAIPDISLLDLFLGNHNGVIGEISALCILIGGAYLLIKKIIAPHIPFSYIGTVALISLFCAPSLDSAPIYCLYSILSGGLLLCAFFMATDYVTSPVTPLGRIIFGVSAGAITMAVRLLSSNAEGASFAVLIMNLLVYYIDRYTAPRRFGEKKKKRVKESA